MGLRLFGRCSVYPDPPPKTQKVFINASAPDPINFEILELKQVKRHVVAKIKYPDCTNYEGIKICLFLYTTVKQIEHLKEIDPHFSTGDFSPFARFKPNEIGWLVAIKTAEMI